MLMFPRSITFVDDGANYISTCIYLSTASRQVEIDVRSTHNMHNMLPITHHTIERQCTCIHVDTDSTSIGILVFALCARASIAKGEAG